MNKELTLEETMAQLERTMRELENPNVSFSRGIELYGTAAELLTFCFKEFETANTKITQLNEELEKAEKRLTEYSEYSDEITDDNAEDYYE